MKILILTSWLAPYRVDLFNELAINADVNVMYYTATTSERNKNWIGKMSDKCTYRKINQGSNIPILGSTYSDFISEIRTNGQSYDVIYIDGYGAFGLINAMRFLSKQGIHYFVNIDGALIREKESKIVYCLKKWILKRECTYLCGSKVSNKYLMRYGVEESQIVNHPFTSLFRRDILKTTIDKGIKQKLRNELNINDKYVILSVGRFTYKKGYGKGYDAILRAASKMSNEYGFYIIGDEPTDEFIKMREDLGANNVHFIGFKQKDELRKFYQASDIFVLMTVYDVWGLVINEAMSNGLPIITTDMCVAGLELIKDGENGYVIPVGDYKTLRKDIECMCSDEDRLLKMSKRALSTIQEYTIENVATAHMKAFNEYITSNKNVTANR